MQKVLEGLVELGLEPVGFRDGRLQVVGLDAPWYSTEVMERVLHGRNEVFLLLSLGGLHVGVLAGRQRGHEHFHIAHLSRIAVSHFKLLTGIIQLHDVSGLVVDMHDRIDPLVPPVVIGIELRESEAIGMKLVVLGPHDPARDARFPELFTHIGKEGLELLEAIAFLQGFAPGEDKGKGGVVHSLDVLPGQFKLFIGEDVLPDDISREPQRGGDRLFAVLLGMKPEH